MARHAKMAADGEATEHVFESAIGLAYLANVKRIHPSERTQKAVVEAVKIEQEAPAAAAAG